MFRILIWLIPLLSNFIIKSNAQGLIDGKNLVQDSSFEEIDSCSGNSYGILFLKKWWPPNGPIAVYYSACSPLPNETPSGVSLNVPYTGTMDLYQQAHTGSAFIELGMRFIDDKIYTTSYIETLLIDTLESNQEYCVEFYINLPDFMINNYYTGQTTLSYKYITGFFSDTSIATFPSQDHGLVYYYDFYPSFKAYSSDSSYVVDTLNWIRMTSQYTAIGGERFLTIGSLKISRSDFYIISNPSAKHALAVHFIDDVAVYKGKCREEEKQQKTFFNLYPNPGSGLFSLNYGVAQNAQLVVYDILGRTVLNETLRADMVLHHFNLSQMSNGMYFLKVISANDENLFSQKFLLQR